MTGENQRLADCQNLASAQKPPARLRTIFRVPSPNERPNVSAAKKPRAIRGGADPLDAPPAGLHLTVDELPNRILALRP